MLYTPMFHEYYPTGLHMFHMQVSSNIFDLSELLNDPIMCLHLFLIIFYAFGALLSWFLLLLFVLHMFNSISKRNFTAQISYNTTAHIIAIANWTCPMSSHESYYQWLYHTDAHKYYHFSNVTGASLHVRTMCLLILFSTIKTSLQHHAVRAT